MKKITNILSLFLIIGIITLLTACTLDISSDSYTVSFVVNSDDITTKKLTYAKDSEITLDDINEDVFNNTTPTKAGYTMDTWYTTKDYSKEVTFPMKVTQKTSIYLKWIENAKDSNDDSSTNGSGDNNSTGESTNNGSNNNSSTGGSTETVTYKVEFYDGTTKLSEQTVEKDDYAEELLTSITNKTGYTFVGWYTDSNLTTAFNLATTKITSNIKLYAKYTLNVSSTSLNISAYGGYNEGAYVEFEKVSGASLSNYEVYYQKSNASTATKIDSQLIREGAGAIRADIVGLSKGTYTITVKVSGTDLTESKTVTVTEYDRSGYAHFNTSTGVGAYNNDGTLKSNAVVVYVNEENKNTVTAKLGSKTYTGLVNIIQNQKNSNYPLVIRILGTVGAATWNEIEYNGQDPLANELIKDSSGSVLKETLSSVDDIVAKGLNTLNTTKYSALNGLTNKLKYSSSEYDSYWNMCDVSSAENVTIEGIGPNAGIFQWGFTWKNCSYVEVRNLTFEDYTEDACSFEGSQTSATSISQFETGHIWVHHNTFNMGVNYWDVCSEQDKHDGDGSTDIKGNIYTTFSYNRYYQCHKTGLVGGSDAVTSASVTFHHNYYDDCASRLPLGRQANMHIYNNYYYSCSTTMDIRANAYVFSESNYFEQSTLPKVSDGYVKKSSTYYDAAVKSYNDYTVNCTTASGYSNYYINANDDGSSSSTRTALGTYTKVTDRTATVTSGNIFAPNFDTSTSLFYYDSTNKKSDVTVMTEAASVKDFVKANAGAMTGTFVGTGGSSDDSGDSGDSGSTGGSVTTGDTVILTFNDFTTGDITSTTTLNNMTLIVNTKTVAIAEFSEAITINNQTINKYVAFGGGASYTDGCVKFTTSASANITCYYSSGGSSQRYAAIFNESGKIATATTPTTASSATTIVNYTFSNIEAGSYAIGSSGSGINIVAIVIEYN